ncbi:MAG: hypothetical protein AAF844_05960 [Pseudomonadota bacterium]
MSRLPNHRTVLARAAATGSKQTIFTTVGPTLHVLTTAHGHFAAFRLLLDDVGARLDREFYTDDLDEVITVHDAWRDADADEEVMQ